LLRARRAGERRLLVARRRGDDAAAAQAHELREEEPDTAGGGVDEDPVAVRDRDELAGVRGHLLRVAARHVRPGDALSALRRPGALGAEDRGRLRAVVAV